MKWGMRSIVSIFGPFTLGFVAGGWFWHLLSVDFTCHRTLWTYTKSTGQTTPPLPPKQPTQNGTSFSKDWIVLLTTARNRTDPKTTLEYENMYKHRACKWLTQTSLPIFIVESSGIGFPEFFSDYPPCNFDRKIFSKNGTEMDRLRIVTTEKEQNYGDSTHLEALSLLKAFDAMKDTLQYQQADYLLKVTGRYFLENIEDVINMEWTPGLDFYLQRFRYPDDGTGWQNTEYFGARREFIHELGQLVMDEHIPMEHAFYNLTLGRSMQIFEKGFPNDTPRGGDKMILDPLR